MCEEKGKTQSPARPKSSARGLKGRGVNPQRRGIILSVKTAALFLLMCSSALADISACRDAFDKELWAAAIKECSPLAKAGTPEAQFDLGRMYDFGQGVPQNYEEAVRWYSLAAEQGHAPAQSILGFKYDTGQGVPQDYVQAHMWFNLAGAAGSPEGVKNRDLTAAKITPAQLADAQRLAREWKPSKPKIIGMINSQAGQYSVTPTAVIAMKESRSDQSDIPTAGKTRKLTVVALSHSMSEYDFTVTTPRTTNTNCALYETSVNCRSTSSGGDTQEKAIYTFLQVVSATEGGKVTQYTLSRTARWIWSSTTQLTDGESFPAEIKGKRMSITSRRGGNQGKKETITYDILDIRPFQ